MQNKVFIIEDDQNIASTLSAMLGVIGYDTYINNGMGAIKDLINSIASYSPDMIILDLVLPEVDGFKILEAIKTGPFLASIPVAVFTNLADEESRERCKNLGAGYIFTKSKIEPDDLANKIDRIIKNRQKL